MSYRVVAIKPGNVREHLANATDEPTAQRYAVAARVALANHADVLIEPTGPSRAQRIVVDVLGIDLDGGTP